MGEIYIGHEVVCKYNFVRYAYAHDLVGCHFKEEYYIKREYTILEKKENGEYVYLNTDNKGTILNYKDLSDKTDEIVGCYECYKRKINNGKDCDEIAELPEKVMGVIDVERIEKILKITDVEKCIKIIDDYNNALMNQNIKKKTRKL